MNAQARAALATGSTLVPALVVCAGEIALHATLPATRLFAALSIGLLVCATTAAGAIASGVCFPLALARPCPVA